MTSVKFRLGLEIVEKLADVGAGDEAFLLAGQEDHAANPLIARAFLDGGDDGLKFLDRLAPKRVLRLRPRTSITAQAIPSTSMESASSSGLRYPLA